MNKIDTYISILGISKEPIILRNIKTIKSIIKNNYDDFRYARVVNAIGNDNFIFGDIEKYDTLNETLDAIQSAWTIANTITAEDLNGCGNWDKEKYEGLI